MEKVSIEKGVNVRAGAESMKQGLEEDLGLGVCGGLRVPSTVVQQLEEPGSAGSVKMILERYSQSSAGNSCFTCPRAM